jgi:hypothetical protein
MTGHEARETPPSGKVDITVPPGPGSSGPPPAVDTFGGMARKR